MDVVWAATASIAHLHLPSERWALMAVDTRGYDGCGNQDFRRGGIQAAGLGPGLVHRFAGALTVRYWVSKHESDE